MVNLKEFDAWIEVNGQSVPEFNTLKDGNTVTCFIPSEAGKTFVVHWRDRGTNKFSAAYILLDGFACPGRFLSGLGAAHRSGVRSGPNSERPFMFADFPMTEDRDSSSSGSRAMDSKKVGMIELKIMLAERGDGRKNNDIAIPPSSHPLNWNDSTGGHFATFGSSVPYYDQSETTWSLTSFERRSYVKFIFYYRSLNWLLGQGMIGPPFAPANIGKAGEATFTVSLDKVNLQESAAHPVSPSVQELFAADTEEDKKLKPRKPLTKPHATPGKEAIRVSKREEKREAEARAAAATAKASGEMEPRVERLERKLSGMELRAKYKDLPSAWTQSPQLQSRRSSQSSSQAAQPQQPVSPNAYVVPAGPPVVTASVLNHGRPSAGANPPGVHRPSVVLDTRVYKSGVPHSPLLTPAPRGSYMHTQTIPVAGSSGHVQQPRLPVDARHRDYSWTGAPASSGPVPSLSTVTRLKPVSAALMSQYAHLAHPTHPVAQRSASGPSGSGVSRPGPSSSDLRKNSRYSLDDDDF